MTVTSSMVTLPPSPATPTAATAAHRPSITSKFRRIRNNDDNDVVWVPVLSRSRSMSKFGIYIFLNFIMPLRLKKGVSTGNFVQSRLVKCCKGKEKILLHRVAGAAHF